MSITRKGNIWLNNGRRISANEVAEYIHDLEKQESLDSDAIFAFLQPLIGLGRRVLMTLIVGVVAIMLIIYAINHLDFGKLLDGIAYFGGVVFGVLVIVLIIALIVKALPMIWGWLKTRWNRIGSGSSTSKEV